MLVDVGQVVPSQSGKVLFRLVHHKVAGDEVEAPAAQLPGVVQLGEDEEGWGGGGGGGGESFNVTMHWKGHLKRSNGCGKNLIELR